MTKLGVRKFMIIEFLQMKETNGMAGNFDLLVQGALVLS